MMVEGKMTDGERNEMINLLHDEINRLAKDPNWPVIGIWNTIGLYSSNKNYFDEINGKYFRDKLPSSFRDRV